MNTETSRKKIKESAQNCIRSYIESHIDENTFIENRAQIYSDLKNEPALYQISKPTFYRYLDEMNLTEISPGKYDFSENIDSMFYELISFEKFNKFLCIKVLDKSYSQLIAKLLNDYYTHFKDIFKCVAKDDLIICFYYQKTKKKKDETNGNKEDKFYLTEKIIRNDVKECLKQYSLRIV